MRILEENVHVEPVTMIRGDPIPGEIELKDTKLQIDVQTSEKEADLDEDDTECVEIWLDDDEIGDQTVFYLSSESDDEPIVVPMSKKSKTPKDSGLSKPIGGVGAHGPSCVLSSPKKVRERPNRDGIELNPKLVNQERKRSTEINYNGIKKHILTECLNKKSLL